MGSYHITMPDVGEGIAEVEIVEWNVKVGDSVEEDDLLCAVMTDKVTVEIPSPVDGKITWIGCHVGEVMAVGADLLFLDVEGEGNAKDGTANIEKPPAPESTKSKATKPVPAVIETAAKELGSKPAVSVAPTLGAPRPEGEKPIAPPAVRQRARNAGVDLRYVRGTGPANRIGHDDLNDYIAGKAHPRTTIKSNRLANTAVEELKIIGLRRKIASIMQDTMQRIPHFTYVEEVDVTELEVLRAKLNSSRREDQPKLTLLPFVIRALVKALIVYPQMSARFDDTAEIVYRYGAAHVGIATQTDNGLVVPVIKHAEALDIWQTASEVRRLSNAAREGKANREELAGSSITISSLGPMGGIVTTPVINSPEVAIIGINKIAKRPVWQDGAFIPKDIMNLSSSFDHRLIDGWNATQFVQHIKGLLESPATLFIEE